MQFYQSKMYSNTQTPKKKKQSRRLSEIFQNSPKSFNDLLFTMKLQNLPDIKTAKQPQITNTDKTLNLPDPVMLNILSKVPALHQDSIFLVCKRWLYLQGRLVRTLKVFDWEFIESGRVFVRFPNVAYLDLVPGCLSLMRGSGVSFSGGGGGIGVLSGRDYVDGEVVDRGLRVVASGFSNLRRLAVVNASEMGLLSVAEECVTLQEIELHRCGDNVLRGIAACGNLQIVKLVGCLDGFCGGGGGVSDVGLTILAQGCPRLVKLELSSCGGSFDGIKAIGQCCQMLEELMICDHRMESGWLAAVAYCENLKTLKIQSCKNVDPSPGEYVGCCPALERLHLHKCHLQNKKSVGAIFAVCSAAREIIIEDCWGLENDIFSLASCCRRVRYLSLEGCLLLTTQGLESVILHWKDLERLCVVSCKNIKDSEISPALSNVFSVLKNLKWTPDTKSFISSARTGTGMGKRGGRFFKKILNLKSIPDDYGLRFDFIHR